MFTLLRASRARSVLGVVLAVSFVPVLIGISACLDFPIGDPEKGWADPRISGAWLTGSGSTLADFEGQIWVFEPWDSRTWLIQIAGFSVAVDEGPDKAGVQPAEDAAPAEDTAAAEEEAIAAAPGPEEVLRVLGTLLDPQAAPNGVSLLKGWLTSIGNRRFLVLEPKAVPDDERGLGPHIWYVFHIVVEGDRMELAWLSADDLSAADTRGEAEQVIARRLDDPDFYEEPWPLYRIPRSAFDEVREALERQGLTDL
jgi:hypothetical protein